MGLFNSRVRVQLVLSLTLSHLMFGCVVWSSLMSTDFSFGHAATLWNKAEILLRKMLRWALHMPRDTRLGFLYFAGNLPTV